MNKIYKKIKMISHLDEKPFEKIKNGTKKYELRLLDEKRKKIRVGDKITFVSRSNHEDSVTVRVTGLLNYKTFAEAYDSLKDKYFNEYERGDFIEDCYGYYTVEEELKLSVLIIEIEL